jgi:hypothetical protein
VHKPVSMGRPNGFFVKLLGSEFASFDSGNFCTHQSGPILEILRAIASPERELPMMFSQRREVFLLRSA